MTEKDLTIQNLRRENEALRAELEWTGKEIMRLRNQLKMQWIPCSEKLPEEWIDDDDNTYINYLIYMPYFKAASVGVYNDDEESWLFRGVKVKVSHWMPLPDAPAGVRRFMEVSDNNYELCVSCAHKLRAWLSGKENDNG